MRYDVIVVGGGHAGVEAATAAARRGASTALLTFDPDHVGAMSCNPAIGGLGKGHLVREVDAFDGIIARAADAAAIHHRLLNRSKGAAVQGPRVQADRAYFHAAVQAAVAGQQNLTIMSGEAVALEMAGERIVGVRTPDRVIETKAVVLATGTFLGGRLFCGDERKAGGRIAERGATRLAYQLREIDLPMARLKTGTPPRLDGRTIDWAMLDRQASDEEQWSMSPATRARVLPQLACAITRTNERGHDLIRGATSLSPLYDGSISAGGPRYCPSIEDKVVRFPDRDGHQIFLEPEGLRNHIVYPNGISTSLPRAIQQKFVRTIAGLQRAEIVQPGYAVEYDHIDPRALDHRLAVALLPGLFCAGQINGTTGYEEAAAQGLIAGLNAAAHALDLATYVPNRATSYLGVMIDDLVLQGVTEPYRMLTARAEFRLALRADNADTRLTPDALALGCLSDERIRLTERRAKQRELARAGGMVPADILREVEEDERYRPYVARQNAEIERIERDAAVVIPKTLRFEQIPGLSTEMIERLTSARPASIAEVSRIRGVTPAALSAIWLNLRKVS